MHFYAETGISGCQLFFPKVFADTRGKFFESYSDSMLELKDYQWVQDNQSSSDKYVFRGLHGQYPPYAQTKLVRCVNGELLDIVYDARPESPTFKKHAFFFLGGVKETLLLVPKGCLHGFISLAENTIISYKVDALYSREHDVSVNVLDPEIGLDVFKAFDFDGELNRSEKDEKGITLSQYLDVLSTKQKVS